MNKPAQNTFGVVAALSLLGIFTPDFAVAQSQDWQHNRITPLQKVTVGPWDNFEVSVTADDQTIYFTRDQNQVPNIYTQELPTIETERLIGRQGDAKQPALSPDQTQLAFVFYGQDAQGDLCLMKLAEDNEIQCLSDNSGSEYAPFWITNDELGYLRREQGRQEQNLMLYQISSEQHSIVHSGIISAPSASTDARYLIFNAGDVSGSVQLSAFDRQTQTLIQPPKVDLPGITGTHAMSLDGQHIYFSQYLNDTNGDQVIDGNDHSVLFRMPLQDWLASEKPLLPEQLTAVDNNCKFPALSRNYLYVTCAFEGSLDIYRLPPGGVVPQDWQEEKLLEAHLAARSHEQRLLLLNTMRYRLEQNGNAMLERLLSNHLEIGELTAAQYYLNQLAERYQQDQPQVSALYQVLSQLLHVRGSKQRIPVGVITARFTHLVKDTRQSLKQLDIEQHLKHYLNAELDYELGNFKSALARIQQVDLSQTMLPLERYLNFDLLRRLLEKDDRTQLSNYYPAMYGSTELPQEARIYYAFNHLKLLEKLEPDTRKRAERIADLNKQGLPAEVTALFSAEAHILALLNAKNADQNKAYKRLSQQLKSDRKYLHLRKAQHIRAISQLGGAELFQFMELLSRHWLLTTHISEMEFVNTAEQYSIITMDKAYGMLADGQEAKAYNIFYSAIRQTNDLEAHYQFISLGLNPELNKRDNLETAYQQFQTQGLIGDKRHYTTALRLVIEAQARPADADKLFSQALTELNKVQFGGLSPAMRDLLMGYIYHQRVLRSKDGYHYDQRAYQKAHYHYMMALDLGHDNHRISASIYENLAWLHFDVGQYAYSADLFSQRQKIAFTDDEARLNTLWASARARFYASQYPEAWQTAEQALALSKEVSTKQIAPFIEKTAFYALQANQYSAAVVHYQQLFEQYPPSGHNRAKALLAYGFALMKDNQRHQARARFQELLVHSKTLSTEAADANRLLALIPQRQQLLAHGFLANMARSEEEHVQHLKQRIKLLNGLEGDTDAFGYSELERTAFLSKDYLKLAISYEKSEEFSAMYEATNQALASAIQWTQESGDAAGPVTYYTLVNCLSLAISNAEAFAKKNPIKNLDEQVLKTLKAYKEIPLRSASIISQQSKVELLWQGYLSLVTEQIAGNLPHKLDSLMSQPEIKALHSLAPDKHNELKQIAENLIQ